MNASVMSKALGSDDLFNDKELALKNRRLMGWAKVATFGLYMVAVFMLYVSDIWGLATFINQNLSEWVALSVFSVISFVLSYFLASSKEATYEDIAIQRSLGYELRPVQKAAMVLFLCSGVLFEMFSTTNNQQHIANNAAENSSILKSLQNTEVTVGGASYIANTLADAEARLVTCNKRLVEGKVKDCQESSARVSSIKASMQDINATAKTASESAMNAKTDAMLKVRESFDKPLFKAMSDVLGTSHNAGMILVVAVLITIFELQHILALFAYANALRRLKQSGINNKPINSPTPSLSVPSFVSALSGIRNKVADGFIKADKANADILNGAQNTINAAVDKVGTYRDYLKSGGDKIENLPLDAPYPLAASNTALPAETAASSTASPAATAASSAASLAESPTPAAASPAATAASDYQKAVKGDAEASGLSKADFVDIYRQWLINVEREVITPAERPFINMVRNNPRFDGISNRDLNKVHSIFLIKAYDQGVLVLNDDYEEGKRKPKYFLKKKVD